VLGQIVNADDLDACLRNLVIVFHGATANAYGTNQHAKIVYNG
jgi:hypothetical protein